MKILNFLNRPFSFVFCLSFFHHLDSSDKIMVDKLIETSMYTNLNKNEVSKEKMDNTAYVKEIMEEYSSYKEFC